MSGAEPGGVRLVVSDVDGTLVDRQKQLAAATVAAVGRLRDAGIGFTLISARPRSGMMPIAETMALDAPMGAFNGGTVFRRDGTILCQHRIDAVVAAGVLAIANDAAVDVWVFAGDRWYASTDHGHHVDSERIAAHQAPIVTTDFARFHAVADKVTFVSDDPAVLKALHEQAGRFDDRATIAQSQTYYLDVTALSANKGDGVAALAAAMDVPLTETAVFGDQANDLPMFARAAVSYAMGQGPEAVRAKASHVVASNDADGVAEAIDHILRG